MKGQFQTDFSNVKMHFSKPGAAKEHMAELINGVACQRGRLVDTQLDDSSILHASHTIIIVINIIVMNIMFLFSVPQPSRQQGETEAPIGPPARQSD